MPASRPRAAWKLAFSSRSAKGERASISRHQRDGLLLEPVERHDRVHEPHLQRLLRVVLAAQEPDLLGLLQPDECRRSSDGAEAAVEGADARAGLAEARVVGGDREVADEVQDVPAADRVAGDHRDDRLRQPAHLHVQVGDVEAPDRRALGHVAGVAAHALVAAGAERQSALAGEDDRADRRCPRARARARCEISTIVCGRNALRTSGRSIVIFAIPSPDGLVADVLVVAGRRPVDGHGRCTLASAADGLGHWLRAPPARRPDRDRGRGARASR